MHVYDDSVCFAVLHNVIGYDAVAAVVVVVADNVVVAAAAAAAGERTTSDFCECFFMCMCASL